MRVNSGWLDKVVFHWFKKQQQQTAIATTTATAAAFTHEKKRIRLHTMLAYRFCIKCH